MTHQWKGKQNRDRIRQQAADKKKADVVPVTPPQKEAGASDLTVEEVEHYRCDTCGETFNNLSQNKRCPECGSNFLWGIDVDGYAKIVDWCMEDGENEP